MMIQQDNEFGRNSRQYMMNGNEVQELITVVFWEQQIHSFLFLEQLQWNVMYKNLK